jgi:trans-aconitate methyltransferase
MGCPVEWDAEAYDRISDPQYNWGRTLLDSLSLRGNETVLDAGCGTGRLAEDLVNRLPNGKVIALDSSENMVGLARERLAKYGMRAEVLRADLADFQLPQPVDVIFSNAVFHWVPDHDALFRNLYRALKPGGRLCAQFGGEGNLQRLRGRLQELVKSPDYAVLFGPWNDGAHYEPEAASVERLRRAGFQQIQSGLHAAPVSFRNRETFALFIRKVNIHRYLAKLPPEHEQRFIDYLADQAAGDQPPFTLDYVRLTITADRP